MKRFFEYTGLYFPKIEKVDRIDVKYRVDGTSQDHLTYLKELFNLEKDRQATIEGKTSQLVGQTSLVFALAGLFLPLFYQEFLDADLILKSILILFFGVSFFFYFVTIIHSTRNFAIRKYRYSTGAPDAVLTKRGNKFIKEQIQDLLVAINVNTNNDNHKGTNLILAHRTFIIANGAFALLAIAIASAMLFTPPKPDIEAQQLQVLKEIKTKELKLIEKLLEQNAINNQLLHRTFEQDTVTAR